MGFEMWFYFTTRSADACHKQRDSLTSPSAQAARAHRGCAGVRRTAAAHGHGNKTTAEATGPILAAPSPPSSPPDCGFTWCVVGECGERPWPPAFTDIAPLSFEKPRPSWEAAGSNRVLPLSPVSGPPRGGRGPVLPRGLAGRRWAWREPSSVVRPRPRSGGLDGSSGPCVWSPRGRGGR